MSAPGQLLRRAALRLMTPPSGTGMRDALGLALLVQGVIRVIDGRLFAVTHLRYGDNAMYGALMIGIGLWLLVTRWKRSTWYGALGASLAGMFYLWLAVAVWQASATSGGQAIVYALALLLESRAWAGRRTMWNYAT